MERIKAGAHITEHFTPSELWDHIDTAPDAEIKKATYGGLLSEAEPDQWNSGKGNARVNFKQATELARNGWPEGLAKIAPTLARVDDMIAHTLPENVMAWDVAGETPDVGAYLAGVPENMITTEEADGAARMIRIIVNFTASGAVDTETIMARGVIACALIDALEHAGYRVEVTVALEVTARNSGGRRYSMRSTFKRPEEPLNLDRLVFALIHPAMLRRVGVRCIELTDTATARALVQNNYGSPEPVMGEKGDIVIGELYGTGWTPERMASEVLKYLQEVGVHMIEGAKV